MNHEQAQRSISSYLRGELSPAERQSFLTHINSCPRCESELAIATRLHNELPVAAPYSVKGIAPLPGPLAARVRQAVYAQERQRRPFGWLDWLFPGAQPSLPRLFVNVLGVFVLLAVVAIGAVALHNAFQPGPKQGYAADFTYARQQGLTYIFTDTTATSDTLTYTWDFGDGGKATSRNPIHSYGMTGAYTVSMAISGPLGSTSKEHSLSVSNPTIMTLSPTPSPSPTAATVTAIPQWSLNTVTPAPAPTDTLAPLQPTVALPNLDPTPNLLPSATPLPTLVPTLVGPQPIPTRPAVIAPSATARPSATNTQPAEPSNTPLPSSTPLPLLSSTPLPSSTSLPTATPPTVPSSTPLPSQQPSSTPLPTHQPSNTPLPEPSNTPRPEPTHTPLPSGTPLPPTSTPISEPSNTPLPTETHAPSATPTPTVCGDACHTPQPTSTPGCPHDCQTPPPTATHQPSPTNTPIEPTHVPTNTPTETPHPEPTQTPAEATETPGPTCTPVMGGDDPEQHGC